MKRKMKVAIICGGKSVEHEISLQSAKNVIEAMDKDRYEILLIGLDREGRWHLKDVAEFEKEMKSAPLPYLSPGGDEVVFIPAGEGRLLNITTGELLQPVDVVFPILHGPFGEDGTIQGLLKIAEVPFVGAGVLSSALVMDKEVSKRLLKEAGIPTSRFLSFTTEEKENIKFSTVIDHLGLPLFVKPANLGSSVGMSKVKKEEDFAPALEKAFRYDNKILIEEYIEGREIECAVLGNEQPRASCPGEVIPRHEFYSYEAKYVDPQGAILEIPASLPQDTVEKIQYLAIQTFRTLYCEGMARVDFFLRGEEILVNELNTIPGFTSISMYPKLWEASGLPYPQLIDELIQLSLARREKEKKLQTFIN